MVDISTEKEIGELVDQLTPEEAEAFYVELMGYEEKPLKILDFLYSPDHLGEWYNNILFPVWEKELNEIFPTPYTSPYSEVIFTGAIGVMKTKAALAILFYDMYLTLLLKEPSQTYFVTGADKIFFHLFSSILRHGGGILYNQCLQIVEGSPFFADRINPKKGKVKDASLFIKNVDISVGSRERHAEGGAVFSALMDEVNTQTQIEDQAFNNYTNLAGRMTSRFMQYGGRLPGHLCLVSSSKHANSYLEKHIKAQKENPNVKVTGFSIWEAKAHLGVYGGKTFKVFIGSDNRDPKIIDKNDDELLEFFPDKIIDVPIELYSVFNLDIYTGLKDHAGISFSGGERKLFTSKELLMNAFPDENDKNYIPFFFTKEVLELDFRDKESSINDFFEHEKFFNKLESDAVLKNNYFLHVDIGLVHDRLGLGISTIVDKVKDENGGWVPVFKTYLGIAIKAKPGQEVPLYKVRNFIFYLREKGLRINKVTADKFQSAEFLQLCEVGRIETEVISVDRTPEPYLTLRNAVNEGRWFITDYNIIKKELSELIITLDDKVDHPHKQSKDVGDAVAGSGYAALKDMGTNLGALDRAREMKEKIQAYNVGTNVDERLRNILANKIKTNRGNPFKGGNTQWVK